MSDLNLQNYFSHDSNARNDTKILNLRSALGAEGYGIYFMLLERLRDSTDYTSVTDYNAIAFDLRVSSGTVKKVVEDFGLFSFTDDGARFYSESFLRRMEFKDNKKKNISEKRRAAANKRWENEKKDEEQCKSNASAMQMHTKKMQNDAKGKESKVKESKVKCVYDAHDFFARYKKITNSDFEITHTLENKFNQALEKLGEETINKALEELKLSEKFLIKNPNISLFLDNIEDVADGKYRDFKNEPKKTSFNNFESSKSSLKDDDLNKLVTKNL